MVKVSERAPGKLYIAGEYAVVTPHYSAIGMAVDRYLTVTIEDSDVSSFYSKGFTDKPISFDEIADVSPLSHDVIKTIENYLEVDLRPCTISIESELDDADGRKYGLGSSGALTVALVKALLRFHDVNARKMDIFKLSALSHLLNGNNGSFGDLAISAFGGVISYTNFERTSFDEVASISEWLEKEWTGLKIEPILLPEDIQFVVGWTGAPVSTDVQVSKAYEGADLSESTFLAKSQEIVSDLPSNFLENIEKNRVLLQELSEAKQVIIETPKLTKFIEIVEKFGGKAKTSGSGGGDSGIGFFDHEVNFTGLEKKLENNGILRLNLEIAY